MDVPVGVAVGVELGVAVGLGVGVEVAAAVMMVVMPVRHVSRVPPALPVPLHWLISTGIAALTVNAGTVQAAVDPPPVTEPLHWVMVAPDVAAG